MEPQSNARMLFDEIKGQSDRFAFLSQLPERPEPFFEEEWIDFKGQPKDDNNAREIWSKALSGFSNTTEGLLVWGIDARKKPPRNIDAASGLRLVADCNKFESRLREWIRDATNPPVMGVEYLSVPDGDGNGFVVCLIPESSHPPHRAEYAKKHYYYRVGDDFEIAAPGFLRKLFYPQAKARLEVDVILSFERIPGAGHQAGRARTIATVVVLNTGTATAKDVLVIIEKDTNIFNYTVNQAHSSGWGPVSTRDAKGAYASLRPIHPEEQSTVLVMQTVFPFKSAPTDRRSIPDFPQLNFSFRLYAEDLGMRIVKTCFLSDDFFDTDEVTRRCVEAE
jgi:Schlafen, AlbA_2